MKRNTNSSNKTRRLVLIGALGGISIFLGISGLGLIRLPIFSLTIMHIPVIIGALLEGPIVGIAVGLIFGFIFNVSKYHSTWFNFIYLLESYNCINSSNINWSYQLLFI